MCKSAALKLQMWGNSLAVRIPSAIARTAGQLVEIRVDEVGVLIVPSGSRDMTLSERLQRFDPSRHGGEPMATRRVGHEAM
jgi:antitoxin MazE